MTVCFFGIYTKNYNRNVVLFNGLKQQGVNIIECHTSLRGIKKYFDLVRQHKRIRRQYDLMFIPYPGYEAFSLTLLAKFLTRKKVVLDIFVSFLPILRVKIVLMCFGHVERFSFS